MKKEKKKVLIYEALYHHEALEMPYQVFKKCSVFDAKLFLGSKVFDSLKGKKSFDREDVFVARQKWLLRWNGALNEFVRSDSFDKVFYLLKLFMLFVLIQFEQLGVFFKFKRVLSKGGFDYVYLNTIDNMFSWWIVLYLKFFYNGGLIIVLHSTDVVRGVKGNNGVESFINRVLAFFVRGVVQKANAVVVLGEYLKVDAELKQKLVVLNNRLIESNKLGKTEKVRFVITGSVKLSRVDYKSVFEGFSELLKKDGYLRNKVELVLLAKVQDRRVLDLIDRYGLKGVVKVYDRFVEEQEFVDVVKRGHYMIVPTYLDSRYGKSSISGSFGDAFALGVPIVLPEHYAKGFEFGKFVVRYDKGNLGNVLGELYSLKDYELHIKALNSERKKYEPGVVAKKFEEVLR